MFYKNKISSCCYRIPLRLINLSDKMSHLNFLPVLSFVFAAVKQERLWWQLRVKFYRRENLVVSLSHNQGSKSKRSFKSKSCIVLHSFQFFGTSTTSMNLKFLVFHGSLRLSSRFFNVLLILLNNVYSFIMSKLAVVLKFFFALAISTEIYGIYFIQWLYLNKC